MTQEQHLVLVIFVGIAAAAFLIQSVAVLGIFLRFRKLSARLDRLLAEVTAKMQGVSDHLDEVLQAAKPVADHMVSINGSIASMATTLRERVEALDKFAAEMTDSSRLQVAKVDDLISGSVVKFDDTLTVLQKSIVEPVTEITALLKGLKIGLEFFFRGPRAADVSRARQDEEMFI